MKKLTAWVEKSFVNKTIFVLLVVSALVVVFVLIPKGIKLIQKTQLINTQIVFFVSGGKKYHLYDDCSNMDNPKESTENIQLQLGRTRCSKCYAGVMNYQQRSNPPLLWILLIPTLFILLGVVTIRIYRSRNEDCKSIKSAGASEQNSGNDMQKTLPFTEMSTKLLKREIKNIQQQCSLKADSDTCKISASEIFLNWVHDMQRVRTMKRST